MKQTKCVIILPYKRQIFLKKNLLKFQVSIRANFLKVMGDKCKEK